MKKLLALALGALLGGCIEGGTVLEITSAIRPEGNALCTFRGDGPESLASGIYDPTFGDAVAYSLALRVVNHMADQNYDLSRGPSVDPLFPDQNTVLLNGVNYCFYREDDTDLDLNTPGGKGNKLINCDDLSNQEQHRFATANGTVPPNFGLGTAVVELLGDEELRILYGAAFDPKSIPAEGAVEDPDAPGVILFDPRSEDPSSPNRSAAWGTFPARRTDRVVIQIQAEGKTQSGWGVKSNVFHYPIEVSIGVLAGRCGHMVLEQCNYCSGIEIPCLVNSTMNPEEQRACWLNPDAHETCLGFCNPPTGPQPSRACFAYAFAGWRPSNAMQPCLYYQGANSVTCEQYFGCSDNL